MSVISVSYLDNGTIVDVEKALAENCDQLDVIMGTVADTLFAAGFGDDHRLIQMQDYWADLNRTVYGREDDVCSDGPLWADSEDGYPGLYAAQDTVADEEVPLPQIDLHEGDVVKVVRNTAGDTKEVLEQVGIIKMITTGDGRWAHKQSVLVSFQSGPQATWWCAPADLDLLHRPE